MSWQKLKNFKYFFHKDNIVDKQIYTMIIIMSHSTLKPIYCCNPHWNRDKNMNMN